MVPKPRSVTATAESLSQGDLVRLFRGEILAVRIPGFCPPEVCGLMSQRLLSHPELAYYPHAPSIGRVMDAFYEGHSDPAKRKRYYDNARQRNFEFRQLSWPYLNPLDHLRLLLADIWPSGAEPENIHGQPMAFGLAQLFKEGASAWPHQDFLCMDEPESIKASSLLNQITSLVYVQPARCGGLLELWAEHYEHDEFVARKNPDTYGLDYAKIPPPSLTIKPEVGDLVMASSVKVHAVTKVEAGLRIAVNCFLGYRGDDQPLTYWS